MKGRFGPKLFFGILIFVPLLVFALSWVVMTLWNYALVPAIGLGELTLWQAMAILVLSKILFTGIKPRPKSGHSHGGPPWRRWHNMSHEDRQAFKERWKKYCDERTSGENSGPS